MIEKSNTRTKIKAEILQYKSTVKVIPYSKRQIKTISMDDDGT
jgi:hypothetical protein